MYFNSYVQSGLVNGTQWDTLMKWLQQSGYNVSGNTQDGTNTNWGNYMDITRKLRVSRYAYYSTNGTTWSNSSTKPIGSYLIKTGASNETKANNIYDLAGNLAEWSSGKKSSNVIRRGGNYGTNSSSYPASYRDSVSTAIYGNFCGFRVVLYLL